MTARVRAFTLTFFLAASSVLAQLSHDAAVSTSRYGPAAGTQLDAAMAAGRGQFLAAWLDKRGPQWAIYATRLNAAGEILDPTGIRIEPPPNAGFPGGTSLVAVLRVDGAYAVVYAYLSPAVKAQTAVATIDDEGRLTGQRFLDEEVTSAATNGSTIVLGGLFVLTVLDRDLRLISQQLLTPSGRAKVGVVSNGSGYLLASQISYWETATELRALDASGGTISKAIASDWTGSLMASDGNDFLAIANPWPRAKARRLTANGEPGEAFDLPEARYSELVWTGDAFVAFGTTTYTHEVIAVRLSPRGEVLGQTKVADTSGQTLRLGAAWNGGDLWLAWPAVTDTLSGETEMMAARLDAELRIGSAEPLSRSAIEQAAPALATGGAHDLVVWKEGSVVYAARLTREGMPLDGEGRVVARPSVGRVLSNPRVAYLRDPYTDGYLVLWLDAGTVRAQMVDDESGAAIGQVFDVASCVASFDVQNSGAELLLAASPWCNAGDPVFLQRLDRVGPIGAPVPLPRARGSAGPPRLASNGNEWLVVWDDTAQIGTHGRIFDTDVVGVRLTSTLALLDVEPLSIAEDRTRNDRSPIVASDGRDFAVAWTTEYGLPKALRVGHDGLLGEALDLRGATNQRGLADAIAWGGTQYLVVLSSWDGALTSAYSSVSVANVDGAVTTVAPWWAELSPGAEQTRNASIASPSGRPLRAVYLRVFEDRAIGGVQRVVARDLAWPRRRAVTR